MVEEVEGGRGRGRSSAYASPLLIVKTKEKIKRGESRRFIMKIGLNTENFI